MTFNTAHVLAAHVIVLHCGLCIRWDGDIQGVNRLVSAARLVRAESLVCVCHTKVVCILVGADLFWGPNFEKQKAFLWIFSPAFEEVQNNISNCCEMCPQNEGGCKNLKYVESLL